MAELCLVGDCVRRPEKRGMCGTHYQRERRAGRLPPPPTDAERFFARVDMDEETGCWLWLGRGVWGGYGKFDLNGTECYAHRWSYEHVVGPIPEGLFIDHLCRVRHCVNPEHLEPVTLIENIRRGRNHGREKTHCPQGHPYAGENLHISSRGDRACRACGRAKRRRQRAAKKLKESA